MRFHLREFVTALLWLACTSCSEFETNVERGARTQTLYYGLGTEPATIDPHLATGLTEFNVMLALFEGLVNIDAKTGTIVPGVATSWQQSKNGLRYTFHLNPAARWSNGDPVRAEDFCFAYQRILSPQLGAPYAYMLYPIRGAKAFHTGKTNQFHSVGVQAINAQTLEIELEQATPYFLSLLTHNTWWPVHPQTILAHGRSTDRLAPWTQPENFVGNGPFRLQAWRLKHRLSVDKNPYYHGRDSVKLNGIHFLPIEQNAEERAFRADYLHLTSSVPIHRIDWYRKHLPDHMRTEPALGVYYYVFNTAKPPLDDPRVRRALAYAIDREALTQHILKAGQVPAYHFTPPNTGAYSIAAQFQYDPERARRLLAEAGYPQGQGFPEFELTYNTSEAHRTLAVAIQQMWHKELGIQIRLYNQEWKAYLATRQAKDFELLRAAWFGDYNDPYTFLSLAESDNGNNPSNWSDPRYDRWMDLAAKTLDPAERLNYFQRAESYLMEEMPFMPLYFYVTNRLVHPSLEGWYPHILDYHPYQSLSIKQL
jgi:oligopeptide transport system substrate-binding protein